MWHFLPLLYTHGAPLLIVFFLCRHYRGERFPDSVLTDVVVVASFGFIWWCFTVICTDVAMLSEARGKSREPFFVDKHWILTHRWIG